MLTYYIEPQNRIPKEELLLGDITVELRDCYGQVRIGSGLIANDLMVKQNDGTFVTFMEALNNATGSNIHTDNLDVKLKNNNHTSVQDIVDGLQEVKYEVPDLQAKYDQLYKN